MSMVLASRGTIALMDDRCVRCDVEREGQGGWREGSQRVLVWQVLMHVSRVSGVRGVTRG